jgi:hypothetical protein
MVLSDLKSFFNLKKSILFTYKDHPYVDVDRVKLRSIDSASLRLSSGLLIARFGSR